MTSSRINSPLTRMEQMLPSTGRCLSDITRLLLRTLLTSLLLPVLLLLLLLLLENPSNLLLAAYMNSDQPGGSITFYAVLHNCQSTVEAKHPICPYFICRTNQMLEKLELYECVLLLLLLLLFAYFLCKILNN